MDDLYGENTTQIDETITPMSKSDKLQYEKELLGIYLSGHPLDEFRGLTQAIDSFNSGSDIELLKEKNTLQTDWSRQWDSSSIHSKR